MTLDHGCCLVYKSFTQNLNSLHPWCHYHLYKIGNLGSFSRFYSWISCVLEFLRLTTKKKVVRSWRSKIHIVSNNSRIAHMFVFQYNPMTPSSDGRALLSVDLRLRSCKGIRCVRWSALTKNFSDHFSWVFHLASRILPLLITLTYVHIYT